jgi:hypothetical protein
MSEPKKLYEIEVSTTVYVTADDAADAIDIAIEAIEHGNVEFDRREIDAYQIRDPGRVMAEWRNAYPFGSSNETCDELARAWEKYERTRPSTAKELEAAGQQSLI